MTVLTEIDPSVHIQVLEQVACGSQLPGISERLNLDLRVVRTLASQAGAPDLGAVRCALERLQTVQEDQP